MPQIVWIFSCFFPNQWFLSQGLNILAWITNHFVLRDEYHREKVWKLICYFDESLFPWFWDFRNIEGVIITGIFTFSIEVHVTSPFHLCGFRRNQILCSSAGN